MNKKYLSYIILGLILLIAAFLRLYRIEDYMGFLGDEGRDALVVKRIIVDHKLTLLGPITSVGLMHLGPAYYYFMLPFLWAWNLNPVGPAIMVALFSLATIVLMWQLAREFFSEKAGMIAGILYALSPLVIIHAHSSWNPNILPFWGLLLIYGLIKVVVKKDFRWLFVVGASLGIAIQLHYVALVFGPIILSTLLLIRFKVPIKYLIGGFIAFVFTYSPFIFFELRHQFINTKTVIEFVTRGGDTAPSFEFLPFFSHFWDLTIRMIWRLVVVENAEASMVFLAGLIASLIYIWKSAQKNTRQALNVLFVWFFVGISLLALYTGNIYDYYLMFIFPFPFLIIGIVFSWCMRKRVGTIGALLVILVLSFIYSKHTSIAKEPNRLAKQAQEISQFILDKAQKNPYNFGLIAAGNSDHAYRYFLEIGENPPIVIENEVIDPERKTATDQLFVVCEEKICQPLGHPTWEIAGFGRAHITDEWNVGLFKIFRLISYQE